MKIRLPQVIFALATILAAMGSSNVDAQEPDTTALRKGLAREIACLGVTLPPIVLALRDGLSPRLFINGADAGLLRDLAIGCLKTPQRPPLLTSMTYLIPSAATRFYGDKGKEGVLRAETRTN